MYVVAALDKGVTKISEKLAARKPKHPDQLHFIKKLQPLKDLLSPESQLILMDVFVHEQLHSETRPYGYEIDQEWASDLIDEAMRERDKPLMFSPFKLPDNISVGYDLLLGLVPVEYNGSYIEPTYLLHPENESSTQKKMFKRLWRKVRKIYDNLSF